MTLTQQRLDVYHQIATSQPRRSFAFGQCAAIFGFLILVASGFAVSIVTSNSAVVATGVLGISGAGLDAYIGATFVKSQAQASDQMRDYFKQPLAFLDILLRKGYWKRLTILNERRQQLRLRNSLFHAITLLIHNSLVDGPHLVRIAWLELRVPARYIEMR